MSSTASAADRINDLARSQIETYRRQPAELVSHFNREVSALDGYRGRQLLELLQNADDAGVNAGSACRLRIDLSRDRLLVANTGRPFDTKGLTSLVVSDCSPKQLDRNRFIGCKGLGFRSVLAWTDRPLISSGPYEVVFDRCRAIEVVRDLGKDDAAIAEIVAEFQEADGRWPVAVMRFPGNPKTDDRWLLEAQAWRAHEFDTVIVLPLGDGDRGDEIHREIREQLARLPASALLFCRYITEVEITGDHEAMWELNRTNEGPEPATIRLFQDGSGADWHVYRRSGRVSATAAATSGGARGEFEIAVAVPKQVNLNPDGALCVFFPTHERIPCALVMHATLETTDDRNRVVDHASNREVLNHLAALVADVLEDQATHASPRRALELLAGVEHTDPELERLGFLQSLIDESAVRRIFPRLDGALELADGVRLAPHAVWLDVAAAGAFPELMPVGPDDPLRPLLSVFKLGWYDPAVLHQQLQRYLPSLARTRAGEIVGRLLTARQLATVGADGLLIGADGHLIQDCNCFFNPVEKLPKLPAWAGGIRFIDAEFQGGLQAGSNSPALRHLAADLSRCGAEVEEYRFDTVARALIGEAERVLAEDDTHQLDRWRQLLRWLFDASGEARQVLPSLPIQVITVGGALRRATSCYLGSAYPRGGVVWRLYKQFDQDEFIGPPETCGLTGVALDEAEEFLVSIGVSPAPRLEPFQSGTEYYQFRRMTVARMAFPRTVRNRLCNNPKELENWCTSYDIDGLLLPDRWFNLLTNGDSTAIAAYLLSTGTALMSRDTDPKAKFMAKVEREWKYWHDVSIPIPNPILHYLRESAWVLGSDGKRHRPSEIMLSGHGVRVLQGVYTQHAINARDPLIAAYGGRDALEGLLTRLGAVPSLESLNGPSLYDLLLSLPERDPRGEVAPGIYRTLIESSTSVEDSPQRESFLCVGRMFARHKSVDDYLPVAQLRYNANLTITKAIEAHIPLVAIPRRMNTGLIKQLFGISSLTSDEISLRLRPEGTEYDPDSEDANLHLRVALPYIYALRLSRNLDEQGRELSLLRKAVLRVCSRAQVSAVLPGGRGEDIILAQPGERIVVDSTLVMVGEYRKNSAGSLTFWLGVAELVAELLGRDVADEVGGVLRCYTPGEMLEVVRVRLGDDAEDKLDEAVSRFADLLRDLEDSGDHPMPAPVVGTPDSAPAPSVMPLVQGGTNREDISSEASKPTPPPGKTTFAPIEGPADKRPKKRRLVVGGLLSGGGGGLGPLATEPVTFRVVEAFEQAEGRFVIPVSHLRGADSFGCDLLSVGSAEVRDKAIREQSINNADILRHIEVKGRSSRTGEVELTDNESLAAKRLGTGYWLYRVYVDPNRQGHYEVALLNDPLKSGAVRLVPRFNLSVGSGATWFTMVETVDDQTAANADHKHPIEETVTELGSELSTEPEPAATVAGRRA